MLEKWKLLRKIMYSKELTAADKTVAFALLDHYGNNQQIFPSNKRLQTMTGLSDRQINRSTSKLHELDMIAKEKKKGKNFYTPTFHNDLPNYDRAVRQSMTQPSPPTKHTNIKYNKDINSYIKKLAKKTNPHYQAVVTNKAPYQDKMDSKMISQMQQRLSRHQFTQWLMVFEDKETRPNAVRYAEKLCK